MIMGDLLPRGISLLSLLLLSPAQPPSMDGVESLLKELDAEDQRCQGSSNARADLGRRYSSPLPKATLEGDDVCAKWDSATSSEQSAEHPPADTVPDSIEEEGEGEEIFGALSPDLEIAEGVDVEAEEAEEGVENAQGGEEKGRELEDGDEDGDQEGDEAEEEDLEEELHVPLARTAGGSSVEDPVVFFKGIGARLQDIKQDKLDREQRRREKKNQERLAALEKKKKTSINLALRPPDGRPDSSPDAGRTSVTAAAAVAASALNLSRESPPAKVWMFFGVFDDAVHFLHAHMCVYLLRVCAQSPSL